MKTKQELLDFYGVEIGKTYRITNASNENHINKTFTVIESITRLTILFHSFLYGKPYDYVGLLSSLEDWTYEEVEPPILDDKEREYLQKYVMDNPAFKGKVESIVKTGNLLTDFERIIITMQNNTNCGILPGFKRGSMYKGMESHRYYTPKELGLEE